MSGGLNRHNAAVYTRLFGQLDATGDERLSIPVAALDSLLNAVRAEYGHGQRLEAQPVDSLIGTLCGWAAHLDGKQGDRAQKDAQTLRDAAGELARLDALINSPQLHDFAQGVVLEAAHQVERWGADHDAGKQPSDWFWLVGFLAGKALNAAIGGNLEKALHHCVSTAAALANWHRALSGADNRMRPGIEPPAGEAQA